MTGANALLVVASYLAGSLPMGLWIGRLRGVDLREHGSGNIGATNAGRVLGKPLFFVVFALDFLKGFLPVLAARWVVTSPGTTAPAGSVSHQAALLGLVCGVAAVVGHVFPIWLRFKGGKGVATAAGVFVALAWMPAAVAWAAWIVTYKLTRYVSLASLVAALVLPLTCFLIPRVTRFEVAALVQWAALCVSALIVVRHRGNIGRLLRGEEPKSGASRAAPGS